MDNFRDHVPVFSKTDADAQYRITGRAFPSGFCFHVENLALCPVYESRRQFQYENAIEIRYFLL